MQRIVPLLLAVFALASCGREDGGSVAGGHPWLGARPEAVADRGGVLPASPLADRVAALSRTAEAAAPTTVVTVDYPEDGSVFPPEFIPPSFLWHDPDADADTWLVHVDFQDEAAGDVDVLVPRAAPPVAPVDERAVGETNEIYHLTPYQASAVAWTPSAALWEVVKRRSSDAPAQVTITGFSSSDPGRARSRGSVAIRTSKDEVGAPIFYRDVPLMPGKGERGRIQPLSTNAIPLIGWRLRDVSRPESRLVLQAMPSCGNCHSFSRDGKTLGMDVDGPQGDKGTYAIAEVKPRMSIDYDDIITWNSFPDKPKGHKTIGFLSRVSPDGRYVVSTVNEALYVANFLDYRVLQVFYPTRGILAFYDRRTGRMKAVPGADDPAYVHCNAVWSPDGKWLIFSRATAKDPYEDDRPVAAYPNDPNETPIQYDLYRIPFDGGRGGTPEPVRGASANGMSNSFPKVSPDGKWIVWVKCRNGQLLRPDGRLWIVPFAGGTPRKMHCNTDSMNSWHSFSPNGRWMVFTSKVNRPYTQMFLTHLDEDGNDTPPILIPGSTASNRAVNLPEFLNAPYDALEHIDVPAVKHQKLFWEGVDLIREGHPKEAIPLLEKAIALEPDFSRAEVNLGMAHAVEGRYEEAIRHYRKALRINPDDTYAYNNLGRAMEVTGHPDQALGDYEAALARDPTLLLAHKNAARILLTGSDPARAVPHLAALIQADPDDLESRWALSAIYLHDGRVRKGIAELEAIIDHHPDDVRTLSTLAWVLATSPRSDVRDGERAVAVAEKAVQASGRRRPEPLDALAAALAETGRTKEAVAIAREALELLGDQGGALRDGLQSRIALYRDGRPFRQ